MGDDAARVALISPIRLISLIILNKREFDITLGSVFMPI